MQHELFCVLNQRIASSMGDGLWGYKHKKTEVCKHNETSNIQSFRHFKTNLSIPSIKYATYHQ
jgi:hypothetical protein